MITNYEQQFAVTQCDCDMFNRMTIGAILRRAQQLSTDHCNSEGLTEDVNHATNTAFLLAKSKIEFVRPILYGENLTIKTQAYGPLRAVYCRQTQIYDNDTLLVSIDSHWILIDTSTKHIMRKAPEKIAHFFPQVKDVVEPISITKANSEEVDDVKAVFTMCDINNHINNAVYADLITNYIPEIANKDTIIKSVSLNYKNEIAYNKEFKIYRGELDENGYYFYGAGTNDDGTDVVHFEANVNLL